MAGSFQFKMDFLPFFLFLDFGDVDNILSSPGRGIGSSVVR